MGHCNGWRKCLSERTAWKGESVSLHADIPKNLSMVIKCSRDWNLKTMPGRNLWLAFTGLDMHHIEFSPLEGPIAGNHSKVFVNPEPRNSMAEGPSLLYYRDRWLLAWDEPAGAGVQHATSPDLQTRAHIEGATFPSHAYHGTLFLAPR